MPPKPALRLSLVCGRRLGQGSWGAGQLHQAGRAGRGSRGQGACASPASPTPPPRGAGGKAGRGSGCTLRAGRPELESCSGSAVSSSLLNRSVPRFRLRNEDRRSTGRGSFVDSVRTSPSGTSQPPIHMGQLLAWHCHCCHRRAPAGWLGSVCRLPVRMFSDTTWTCTSTECLEV